MSLKVAGKRLIGTGLILGGGFLYGCVGGTGGGEDRGQGTQFDPSGVGSVSLDVNEDRISVSEFTGFSVSITDSSGAGVPLTRVSCDSERGVAIIEPTTGSEVTDASGKISGKVGCESPGSYLFGCRAAVGANKRTFVTIHCDGPIPAGFTEFPGAGGGGLGSGGNSQNGNGGSGGSDLDGIVITSVAFDDGFGTTTSIDTTQDTDCNNDGGTTTTDIETFKDTKISIKVENNSNQNVTFTGYSYRVPGTGGFQSGDISFSGGTIVAKSGDETTLTSLFTRATSTGKFFINSSGSIDDIGAKNVAITLNGVSDLGEDVEITTTNIATFDNYDNCD